jgi:hypothetical protein
LRLGFLEKFSVEFSIGFTSILLESSTKISPRPLVVDKNSRNPNQIFPRGAGSDDLITFLSLSLSLSPDKYRDDTFN